MSVILTSTTDSPEQVKAALESAGYDASDAVDPDTAEPNGEPAAEPEQVQTPESTEGTGEAAGTPEADKTASEPGADDVDDDDDDEPKPDSGKPGKKRGGFQKKIDKLTADKHRLEGEVAAMQRQLSAKADGAPQGDAAKEPEADKGPVKPTRPKLAEFDGDYDKYEAAVSDYEDKKSEYDRSIALKEFTEQRQREAAEEAQKKIIGDFEARKAEIRAQHEDYDDVVAELVKDDLMVPPDLALAIIESPNGADLMYYMGTHREETERIIGLSPRLQLVEIGKITAALESQAKTDKTKPPANAAPPKAPVAAAPPTKPTSKAPDPIKPVGARTVTDQTSLAAAAARGDFKEYERLRRTGVQQ